MSEAKKVAVSFTVPEDFVRGHFLGAIQPPEILAAVEKEIVRRLADNWIKENRADLSLSQSLRKKVLKEAQELVVADLQRQLTTTRKMTPTDLIRLFMEACRTGE